MGMTSHTDGMTTLMSTAPPATVRRRWSSLDLVLAGMVLLAVAGLVTSLLIRPAGSRVAPVAIGLPGGGRISHLSVDATGVAFDVVLPPMNAGQFVVLVSWTGGAAKWELVAAPREFYLQWADGAQTQLRMLPNPIDDGTQRHVAVEISHGVSVMVDGRAVLEVPERAGPVDAVVLNAVSS